MDDFEEHKSNSEATSDCDYVAYNIEEEGEIFMDA